MLLSINNEAAYGIWRYALKVMSCCLFFLVFSQEVLAQPNFPVLSGRVVDQANILDVATKQYIEQISSQHEQKTSTQFVVATIAGLEGYDIAQYANLLARHWALGDKTLNNGVLLLVAPKERKVRIEVGYGLEGVLTDAQSQQIIQKNIIPFFRDNDVSSGVMHGSRAIIEVLNMDPMERQQKTKRGYSGEFFNVWMVFLFVFASMFRGVIKKRLGAAGVLGISAGVAAVSWWMTGLVLLSVFSFVFALGLFSGNQVVGGDMGRGGGGFGRGGGMGGGFGGGGGSFGGGGASGSW